MCRLGGTRLVARQEKRLQIGEGGGGAVAEGDRLADLQVARDAPILHPAPIFGRHQGEIAERLPRAADLIRRVERRGPEALQRLTRYGQGGGAARRGEGGRAQRRERALRGGARVRATTRAVGGGEDGEIPLGERGGLGAARGEALRLGAFQRVQRIVEPRLIGIEQIGAHRDHGVGRVALARDQLGDRHGSIGLGAREAGRLPEFAHHQPRLRRGGIPCLQRPLDRQIRATEDGGPDLGAGVGEVRHIARGEQCGEACARTLVRRGGEPPQRRAERRLVDPLCRGDRPLRRVGVARDIQLRRDQRRADRLCRADRRGLLVGTSGRCGDGQ